MADEDAVILNAGDKAKRHRSPSYPTIGLRESVERLQKFYKVDGKAGAPPEVAVKHMGYSTAHGQAMSALSALKKFELVAESNGRVVPTQRALEILNLQDGDPRRIQALKDAAVAPPIYHQLIAENQNGLPGDEALESELVTYKNFNPNAVRDFVKDFRESLDFAGISDISVLGLDLEETEAEMQAATEETPTLVSSKSSHAPTRPPNMEGVRPVSQPARTAEEISTPVGKDDDRVVFAHVRFDSSIRKEFVASLKKYLEYLETTLQ
jgi:hypothetical protein